MTLAVTDDHVVTDYALLKITSESFFLIRSNLVTEFSTLKGVPTALVRSGML